MKLFLQLASVFLLAVSASIIEFKNFADKYRKNYSAREFSARFAVFEKNLNMIREHNEKDSSYKLAVNEWADLTWDEFYSARASSIPVRPQKNIQTFDALEIPYSVDWRAGGFVNPVRNQGNCGSCWSFSAIATIESAYAIKMGKLYDLSEQQLVDCSNSYGNAGCNGGYMDSAYEYAIDHPVCKESDYIYTAVQRTCKLCNGVVKLSSFVDVPAFNETALLYAVAKQPVAIGIEADQPAFQFYSSGIFNGRCGYSLDHGVVIVGYGTVNKTDFWIVRNSWGPSWGESGYIRMIRGKNICGIAMMPSYPVL